MLLNPVTSQYVKLIVICVMWLQPLSLLVADEREAVQKKTFTKWVNSHLGRVTCRIGDLYTDLRDGRMLIRLLEVLSGEQLVSITWKQPLPSLTLTQTPTAWPPPCCTSQEEGEIMCFIFSFFLPEWCTSPSASTCFSLFKFLPLVPPHVCCDHMGVDHFSSAPHSQSPPKAACVSTAWRMLIKPCSFSKSKKSI